ncbi:CASP-like protein [Hibiscus syriacus]|uniref:CASP-like protein n=1 Tax=Hibiscus syriacus TaxID=106335 RepID=A0A6A2WLM4_HIBSY|nr:CASP-like protein [Hibiscus syriacus]
MKKAGLFAASVVAASASSNFTCNSNFQFSSEDNKEYENSSANKKSTSTEKFAPRFDGLRFIETLVTAHR